MFVREKRIGRYTYVYLVETVLSAISGKEDVERGGDLDRLARSARGSPSVR
jgi:hypothetical protein